MPNNSRNYNNSSRIEKALGLTRGESKTDYYKRTLGIEK